jgi:hypothetical protein
VPGDQRRSTGLLIPIILIVGLGSAVAFGWWWRTRTKLPFGPMPAETPTKVAILVEQGDRLFREAMDHLKRSDPSLNPDWADENRQAMELFRKSRDSYVPAQDEYKGGLSPPSPLLDRIREVSMQFYFCRKRMVSAERR